MQRHSKPRPAAAVPAPSAPPVSAPAEISQRRHFLYKIIEDSQNTIRFQDTKAAFCVTLLSGMVAVSQQRGHLSVGAEHLLFPVFLFCAICSVLVCLRVIFPTVRPHGAGGPAAPRFYIGQNNAHHWLLHTLTNPRGNILAETRDSFHQTMLEATDEAMLASLSETVVALAFIRQIKSDRLHTAMFCLGATVLMFAWLMIG